MPTIPGCLTVDGLQLPTGAAIYIGAIPIWPASTLYGLEHHCRIRITLAQANAGVTLLSARAGAKYRINDVKIIAIGGNAQATAAATGLAVYGTQAGSAVALYTANLAALTQSAVCQFGTANTAVLADGVSLARNDPNTAITCKAVSAGAFDLITATHFDILLSFCMEA